MKDRAFPKALRICQQKEISQIFSTGQFYRSGFLKFKWTEATDSPVRTVISISKRVGSSPIRNRLKRLIRESLRHTPYLRSHSLNLAIYMTYTPSKLPECCEVQKHIERFFTQLG